MSASTLASKVTLLVDANFKNSQGLAALTALISLNQAIPFTSGVAVNQCDLVYTETRTIAASGSATLDLAGSLVDSYGTVITFARIKAIIIIALAANTNNVVMGAAAATIFQGPLVSDTSVLHTRPGGMTVLVAPDATAWAVGAGSTDMLKFANSGAGTGVTYSLTLLGASA